MPRSIHVAQPFRAAEYVVALAVLSVAIASLTAQQSKPAATGRLISVADLAARAKDENVVVLHVNDRAATFEQAHIPGARPIRYSDVAVDGSDGLGSELPPPADLKRVFEETGISSSSHVVIYGHPVAAARVFFTLDAAGHERVSILDGGLKAWQAEGRPVATGAPVPVARGNWTPRMNTDRVATASFIEQQRGKLALVDVRPDEEFTGVDGGMGGAHAPGHIAGARQLPWNTLVGPDGKFLPADQLRAKLSAAGAEAGKPVVAYCMVGMRASVVYFVARHLGYDPKLYDGSIVDWSRRHLPTTKGR
jgi:thiosulfate/3-mercaptopyruvate sulfurtransferase